MASDWLSAPADRNSRRRRKDHALKTDQTKSKKKSARAAAPGPAAHSPVTRWLEAQRRAAAPSPDPALQLARKIKRHLIAD